MPEAWHGQVEANLEVILALLSNFLSSPEKEKNSFLSSIYIFEESNSMKDIVLERQIKSFPNILNIISLKGTP